MARKPKYPRLKSTATVPTDTAIGGTTDDLEDNAPRSRKEPIEGAPPEPRPEAPASTDVDLELWEAVRNTLYALPSRFTSELVITGVLATDLHSFNTSLGASIEEQVVASLNKLRSSWDPKDRFPTYRFVRSPQRFPDVTLRDSAPNSAKPILMGIELKGWYVLAKEREPSGRYKVTPRACAPQDLLAIVPWALDNVVSGKPRLFDPYVEGARWVAEYRNWWWQFLRYTDKAPGIKLSEIDAPYPTAKADKISDVPEHDDGGNFGRIARTGIMDDYVAKLMRETLAGIPLWAWQSFLKPFKGEVPDEKVRKAVKDLLGRIQTELDPSAEDADEIANRLVGLWRQAGPPMR